MEVDRAPHDANPTVVGQSMALEADACTLDVARQNDDPARWCPAVPTPDGLDMSLVCPLPGED